MAAIRGERNRVDSGEMIGQTISHYSIVAEIGKGGMGVVYRALDTSLGREVAIKVLAPGPKDDPEAQRRLRREARAAAGLAHPGICVVHEIDEADGATFVVMELVKGTPLQALLARGPLTPARALDIALEVAEAMAEAHAHGIVHRDLKPSNVMVTESGRAKVIDFGLAKVLREGNPLESGEDTSPWGDTDPGRIVGTAAYMSPEQVRGRRVDPRSDVFSFGAMLYELLAGRPAFRRDTAVETLHAVLKEPAPRLPVVAGLGASHAPLQKMLDGCLAKEPAARYPSLAALRDELQSVRAGLDAPAASEGSSSASLAGRPLPCPASDEGVLHGVASRPDRGRRGAGTSAPARVPGSSGGRGGGRRVRATGSRRSRPRPSSAPTCSSSTSRCPSSTASRCWSCWGGRWEWSS